MRAITTHHTNDCNRAITIEADEPDAANGNASHRYDISYLKLGQKMSPRTVQIAFQQGPIAEAGINGITNEALLAVVIDRLDGFQTSKYANSFNAAALDHIRQGLAALEARTKERESRGVEGTHNV